MVDETKREVICLTEHLQQKGAAQLHKSNVALSLDLHFGSYSLINWINYIFFLQSNFISF